MRFLITKSINALEKGGQEPTSYCCLEPTVLLEQLELSQADVLRAVRVILGRSLELVEAVLVIVQVSLCGW